jgi:hypothetical protein
VVVDDDGGQEGDAADDDRVEGVEASGPGGRGRVRDLPNRLLVS